MFTIAIAGGAAIAGYLIGSARTYASLDFGSEGIKQMLSTMRPCYGRQWSHWYVERNPYDSLMVFLRLKAKRRRL